MALEWIGELDGEAACSVVAERHSELVRTEAELFYLAAHWAVLHSGEALKDRRRRTGEPVLPGMERAKRAGADGTPEVAEFAAMELGALMGMGHVAAGYYQRDAVNVRHRHPLLWESVGEGRARVWQARRIAQACAHLTLDEARWVDAQTTPYAGALPWGRMESLVAAKVVEVDPEAAEQRRVAAAMARFVRTGRSSEFGLKTLVARASAGDVIFFVAMVDRLADILAEDGDTDPVDVRRSKAIGILATPERALRLLQASAAAHEDDDDQPGDDQPGDDQPGPVGEADVHPSQNDADDTTDNTADGSARRTDAAGRVFGDGIPGCPCACMCGGRTGWDPRRLLPSAVLYLHLSEESLVHGGGVARMEGVGPVTVEQLVELLGHTNVEVKPVVDVAGQVPVDGYEVPDRMREALHLRGPACGAPWATHTSRRKDADHVRPYVAPDKGGPPGQTAMGNLTWLSRFAHRVKTHGRWRLRQPDPGVLEWTSPHGYTWRVDHTGTRYLGSARGSLSWEVYEIDRALDLTGFELVA